MDEPAAGKTIKLNTKGLEFSSIGQAMAGVVHVAKQPNDRNGIAVLDRGIKTLKTDLAAKIVDEGATGTRTSKASRTPALSDLIPTRSCHQKTS